jgi:hypothetical protein
MKRHKKHLTDERAQRCYDRAMKRPFTAYSNIVRSARKKKKEKPNHISRFPCENCGEEDTTKLITLRPGFHHCESCNTDYLVDEVRTDENKDYE